MFRLLRNVLGLKSSQPKRRQNQRRLGVQNLEERKMMTGNLFAQPIATTVQLPTFSFVSVTTTVSVPDGGTVLIGGKKVSLGEIPNGPDLSNIPYVDRLFNNVGTGRDAHSLMMMVTPRIIIQEEE